MDQYRITFRPEVNLSPLAVEAEVVSWPADDWEPIYFWADARATTLVAMVRYDLIAQVMRVDQ